jgi:hypothetical protein
MTVVWRLTTLPSKSRRFLAGVEGRPALLRSDPSGNGGRGREVALKYTVATEGGGGGGVGTVAADRSTETSARCTPRTAPAGTPRKVGTDGG